MRAESIPPETLDHDGVEAVLRDVVAQTEHERAARICSMLVVESSATVAASGRSRSTTSRASSKPGARASTSPSLVEHERVPVEDELVLAADRVAERDPHAVLPRTRGEDRLALLGPPDVEGRRREVDDELGARRDELGRRRPGHPHVLADRDPDARARHVDECEVVAGGEVALLVEDAVVRQVPLLGPAGHLAVHADRAGVVEVAVEESGTPTSATRPVRLGRDALERGARGAHEARPQEQILGRIARHGELGEDDEVGAGGPGLLEAREDQLAVPLEVSDGRIDLARARLIVSAYQSKTSRRPPALPSEVSVSLT